MGSDNEGTESDVTGNFGWPVSAPSQFLALNESSKVEGPVIGARAGNIDSRFPSAADPNFTISIELGMLVDTSRPNSIKLVKCRNN